MLGADHELISFRAHKGARNRLPCRVQRGFPWRTTLHEGSRSSGKHEQLADLLKCDEDALKGRRPSELDLCPGHREIRTPDSLVRGVRKKKNTRHERTLPFTFQEIAFTRPINLIWRQVAPGTLV